MSTEIQYQLFPPLSTDEYERLRADIEAHGIRIPIDVDPEGHILDGYHRARAWAELGREEPYPVNVIHLADDFDKQGFVIRANANRRHLSSEQRAEIRHKKIQLARKMRQAGWSHQRIAVALGVVQATVSGWLTTSNIKDDNACIADLRQTIPRLERAGIFDRLEAGETQVQVAADYGVTQQRIAQIAQQERARRVPAPTSGAPPPYPAIRYRCMVVDPPWPMQKIEREVHPRQGRTLDYPTMPLNEIRELPIGQLAVAGGCHLYLWTTHRYLLDALSFVETWGFRYQCLLTWMKPTGMTPFSWMYNTEHVVFARRGNLPLQRNGLKLSFEAPVKKGHHSRKPDVFFKRVVQASPEPRLNMFAREDRNGFDAWGQEAPVGHAAD